MLVHTIAYTYAVKDCHTHVQARILRTVYTIQQLAAHTKNTTPHGKRHRKTRREERRKGSTSKT